MPEAFVVTKKTAPKPLNVVGEKITVLAPADRTGGYEIFLQDGPANTGPPPHSHPWDETFYVIRGDVEFAIADKSQTANAGTLVHLPAGTIHSFRCGREGALMLSVTSREGASQVFAALDREIPPGPPDVAKIISVISANGVTPGPLPDA